MPVVPAEELVQALRDAIEESRHSSVPLSTVRTHPRKFGVFAPDDSHTELWVYAWTLTPGGRPQLAHEYRIQMTTVRSPLQLNPNGLTVLVGYEPNLKLFGGFDLDRHRTFTTGSPSVQIDIRIVERALQDGLAFHRKGNNELAIGIRPDQFMTYAYNSNDLHKYGVSARVHRLLGRASALEPIPETDLTALAPPRRRLVQTVSRLSRSANFRQQVLQAYGHRCAVTKVQLRRLLDAVYILPVGAPERINDVRNGIALSPAYHRAFDTALIYLDDTYTMRINPAKEGELTRLRLDWGLARCNASLGKILLPPDRRQWPGTSFIQKANRLRRVRRVSPQDPSGS
jgi:putative restriction endonuclease